MITLARPLSVDQREILRMVFEVLFRGNGVIIRMSARCSLDRFAVVVGLRGQRLARLVENVDVVHRAAVGIGKRRLKSLVQRLRNTNVFPGWG